MKRLDVVGKVDRTFHEPFYYVPKRVTDEVTLEVWNKASPGMAGAVCQALFRDG